MSTEPEAGDHQPLYLDLADRLERELGGLAPGTKVSSEHDLVAAHGVSRLTARSALQELERRFVVRRVRGSGTFVARRVDLPVGPGLAPSTAEMERRAGVTPLRKLVSVRTRRPTPAVRDLLDVDSDDRVVSITRTGIVDRLPAWHGTTHVPHELAEDLADLVDADTSIIELLESGFALRPELGWVRADLAAVPSVVAKQLQLEGRPLAWNLEVAVWDRSLDRAVAVHQLWLRADVFRVRFDTRHC